MFNNNIGKHEDPTRLAHEKKKKKNSYGLAIFTICYHCYFPQKIKYWLLIAAWVNLIQYGKLNLYFSRSLTIYIRSYTVFHVSTNTLRFYNQKDIIATGITSHTAVYKNEKIMLIISTILGRLLCSIPKLGRECQKLKFWLMTTSMPLCYESQGILLIHTIIYRLGAGASKDALKHTRREGREN